ncbi:MAG: transposase [Kiritimatiellales bacterium]|jgi:transposase
MKGRERVRVVCIDLSSGYRHLIRRYFPNAKIVSDRFHVIRAVMQHFLEIWKQLDPEGRKNRGLLSLMRRKAEQLRPEQHERLEEYFGRNPALRIIYEAKRGAVYAAEPQTSDKEGPPAAGGATDSLD